MNVMELLNRLLFNKIPVVILIMITLCISSCGKTGEPIPPDFAIKDGSQIVEMPVWKGYIYA